MNASTAIEDSKPRDRAIVVLLLYSALRLTELVTLDVGDARMSARKGMLVVRSGKGDVYREVPLNRPVREALEAWLKIRTGRVAVGETALFVGPQGRRLSARAVDLVIRKAPRRAGLEVSAHATSSRCGSPPAMRCAPAGCTGRAVTATATPPRG